MLRTLLVLMVLAAPLRAEGVRVVTDIPPIHSLVSLVMGDVGAPDLVVGSGSSPHHHAMRPSEARMLAQADVVIWVGPQLTGWLAAPIDNLAQDAAVLTLMNVRGVHLLPFREGAMFEGHDHGGHGGHEDHDDHDDHDDHEKTEEDEAHSDHDDAVLLDPHVWLGPENAILFISKISNMLGEVDPDNAAAYTRNAKAAQAAIATLARQIDTQLAPLRGTPFIVLHDAFHYFEEQFEIEAIGAISAGDAESPGAVRLKTLRTALQDSGVRCAFTEPGVGHRLLDTATEGVEVKLGTLDPLGTERALGPELYIETLRAMAASMAVCLSD